MILSVGDETFPGIRLCTFSGSLITSNNNSVIVLVKNFSGDAHTRRDFHYLTGSRLTGVINGGKYLLY